MNKTIKKSKSIFNLHKLSVAVSAMAFASVTLHFSANAQHVGAISNNVNDAKKSISTSNSKTLINTDGTYQMTVDGSELSRPRKMNNLIQLRRAAPFDPLVTNSQRSAQVLNSQVPEMYTRDINNVVDAYIIQFHTQALPDYQTLLEKAGVEIVSALPPNSIIGLMNEKTKHAVGGMSFIRATADYLPSYKLQEGLDVVIASGSGESQLYSIMSVSKKHRAELERFTQSIGGVVLRGDSKQSFSSDPATNNADSSRFSATLTADQLLKVSKKAETLFIDVRGEEGEDLDQVREREQFNYIEQVAGYCGEGVGAEVYDRGFRLSHQELANKNILVRSPDASGSGGLNHGTEIAGIMYADGINMSSGLLRCASRPIVFSRFSGFPGNNQPNESQLRGHLAELVDPNGPYRAVLQTSSTDYSRTREYTTWSAEYDEVLFDLDFVKLQSQSNAGNRDSRPAAWSKNVVSVGGFHTEGTVDRSDDNWDRASIGPAADDRIKPDLAGQYGGIRTIDDGNDTDYGDFGGTSGATPTVAGAFGIMFEMWADGVFDGGPGKRRDVFDVRPHAATAKALMVHSAYSYDFSGGDSANMSRVHQGWGAPDLRNLYDTAQANGWRLPILIDEEDVVTPGSANSYSLTMDGNQTLKATMVYRDRRGNPAAAIHRINDLTLKVTSPSGTEYWGNNGLRSGNQSTPGGNSNTIDTVENVFVQSAEAGAWTIEVLGDDIILDGHTATPALDAVYALVATGGVSGSIPTPTVTPTPTFTPTPTPEPTCTVEQGFESGNGGWTNSSASSCSTGSFVAASPTEETSRSVITQVGAANSGSNAFFTATNTSAGSNDVDRGNCIASSPTYNVSTASTLSVAYFHGQRDNGDDSNGDFFRLEVSTDGGNTFSSLASNGDTRSTAEWNTVTAAIPAGSNVVVRTQCSDGSSAGDIVECGIDDVNICSN